MEEFIVDCTNNTREERQEVFNWLVKTRGYESFYRGLDYPVIVCNKNVGDSLYFSIEQVKESHPNKEVISFETFKQRYLMERKIIGYKAPTDLYGKEVTKGTIYESCNNANYYRPKGNDELDCPLMPKEIVETWEPVYDGLKVGDWVTIVGDNKDGLNWSTKNSGYTFKVLHSYKSSQEGVGEWLFETDKDQGNGISINKVRKATKEEIEAAQSKTFKVGNFEILVKGGKAFHKSDDITAFVKGLKEDLPMMNKTFIAGSFKYTIGDIIFSSTGCESSESKLSEWLKVYNAL